MATNATGTRNKTAVPKPPSRRKLATDQVRSWLALFEPLYTKRIKVHFGPHEAECTLEHVRLAVQADSPLVKQAEIQEDGKGVRVPCMRMQFAECTLYFAMTDDLKLIAVSRGIELRYEQYTVRLEVLP